MAKFRYHAGQLRGSIGKELTYSSWRGINYVKIYQVPANPRTKDQTAVRSVFKHVSMIAKTLYSEVLKPYTFPPPAKMTAYNRMIQINQPMFKSLEWDPSKLKILDGTLPPLVNIFTFMESTGPEIDTAYKGEETDLAIGVLYDEITEQAFYAIADRTGFDDNETMLVSFPHLPIPDYSKTHAYLTIVRPPSEGFIGNSTNTVHTLFKATKKST